MAEIGEMSAVEFDMWMVRASLEPFSARRLEVGLAQIAMWVYNAHAKKPRPLQDFLLFKGAEPKPEGSIDEQVLSVFGKLMKGKK